MTTIQRPAEAGLDPRSSERLIAFRAAAGRVADSGDTVRALRQAARDPEVRPVLDALPGGADRVVARIEAEVREFRRSPRSNVATAADHARLLLLQQIDVLWWSADRAPVPFADDAVVRTCPELVSLGALRARDRVDFHYRVSTGSWPVRARNRAVRRLAPDHEPHSSGLSYDRARPAMVALLNHVSALFAASDPSWRRGIWVNCLVRSEQVQDRLRELGYSAARSSAHCVGYAADVEMDWLARHGRAGGLQDVLTDLRDAGRINLIDEGQAWHVCLNPAWAGHYEARFTEERSCAG